VPATSTRATAQPLNGQVAVVTGAAGAIGGAIVLRLAGAGAHVVVHFNRNAAGADRIVRAVRRLDRRALAVQADLSNREQVVRLFERTLDRFGRADVLVNNAAVPPGRDLRDYDDGEWDETMAVNVKAAASCTQVFGVHMFDRGAGRVVNIASTAGVRPLPGAHAYVASKAALIGMTRSLALSLAPHVTVNCVVPGFVDSFTPGARLPAFFARMKRKIPLQRLASVQDVAAAVQFLAAEGGYMTGQTLVLDGGWTIAS
jgi:3-oxoacyl-[acyl-carrier protein] reductase